MATKSPGSISTEGLNVYPEAAVEHFSKSNPLRTLGDVYDVAQGVVYLSADTAKFITGEVVVIDEEFGIRILEILAQGARR